VLQGVSTQQLGIAMAKRRNFERHPAVYAISSLVNRKKQVGRPRNVIEREVEEKLLAGFSSS
jgi:hypothetical protein